MLKRLLALAAVIGALAAVIGALAYVGAVHTGALITYINDLTGSKPEENDPEEEQNS